MQTHYATVLSVYDLKSHCATDIAMSCKILKNKYNITIKTILNNIK